MPRTRAATAVARVADLPNLDATPDEFDSPSVIDIEPLAVRWHDTGLWSIDVDHEGAGVWAFDRDGPLLRTTQLQDTVRAIRENGVTDDLSLSVDDHPTLPYRAWTIFNSGGVRLSTGRTSDAFASVPEPETVAEFATAIEAAAVDAADVSTSPRDVAAQVARATAQSLDAVRTNLAAMRAERDALNARIRAAVEDETTLQQMSMVWRRRETARLRAAGARPNDGRHEDDPAPEGVRRA